MEHLNSLQFVARFAVAGFHERVQRTQVLAFTLVIRAMDELPKYSGPALVMGSSPSLKELNLETFEGLRLAIGTLPIMHKTGEHFDYWVVANGLSPLPWLRRHQTALGRVRFSTLVMATAAMQDLSYRRAGAALPSLDEWAMRNQCIVFDQRHIHGHCDPPRGCCAMWEHYGHAKTIQQMLLDRTGISYGGHHSVVFHGIALAILFGANPIYVAGVDLPKRQTDYRHVSSPMRVPLGTRRKHMRVFLDWRIRRGWLGRQLTGRQESTFAAGWDEILADLTNLGLAASLEGSEIVNLSAASLLSNIPTIRTDSVAFRR
jgi:hypothetical protein